jgi:hypothetical protein
MTSSLALAIPDFYTGTSTSLGVSPEAAISLPDLKTDTSVTGHEKNRLFASVVNARAEADHDNWDGDGAPAITEQTVSAAITMLYVLPQSLPSPEITPETTGEIAFEWYKDKEHIAVITVQDGMVRWSAIDGANPPVYGAETFTSIVPKEALEAVRAVIG